MNFSSFRLRVGWIIGCLIATAVLRAQIDVSGSVRSDEDEPLIGVSIVVKGSSTGTVTNLDGDYRITVQEGSTLIYSYTGYGTISRMVNEGETQIDVTLQAGAQLDEVVVTALGISRERKALGYAVEEISNEQIERTEQVNLVNSLQGQAPGVLVSSAGGGPGQAARIIIRGLILLVPT